MGINKHVSEIFESEMFSNGTWCNDSNRIHEPTQMMIRTKLTSTRAIFSYKDNVTIMTKKFRHARFLSIHEKMQCLQKDGRITGGWGTIGPDMAPRVMPTGWI